MEKRRTKKRESIRTGLCNFVGCIGMGIFLAAWLLHGFGYRNGIMVMCLLGLLLAGGSVVIDTFSRG